VPYGELALARFRAQQSGFKEGESVVVEFEPDLGTGLWLQE
jgi:hypothetical protein